MKVVGFWMLCQGAVWWFINEALRKTTTGIFYPWPSQSPVALYLPVNTTPCLLSTGFFALYLLLILWIASALLGRGGEGWKAQIWTPEGSMKWTRATLWLVVSVGLFAVWAFGAIENVRSGFAEYRDSSFPVMPYALARLVDVLFWKPFHLILTVVASPLFPVFVSVAWLLMWTASRARVNSEGLALKLVGLPFSLARVSWERIRRIDIVNHKRVPPALVIHYWTRWRMPFSLSLPSQRYLGGDELIREIEKEATERKVRQIHRYSHDRVPWIAYGFLVSAIGIVLLQHFWVCELWMRYINDEIPISRLDKVFAGLPLAGLFAASVLFFGLYLGLLSSFYYGGFRPALVGAWVLASPIIPNPIPHWYVWFAMYAIHRAQLWIVMPAPEIGIPSWWEMNFAISIISLGPAIAGLGYVLGVLFGCGRKLAPAHALQPTTTPVPVSS